MCVVRVLFWPEGDPSIFSILLAFGFAFFLIWLAIDNWRKRPKRVEDIKEPGWITGLSKMTNGRIFFLGAVMMILNAKNLPVMASAALSIADANDNWAGGLVDLAIFALIGSLGLMVPWLMSIFGGEKTKHRLERMQKWLYHYNNVIMAILFGFLGMTALGNALAMVS